MRKLQSIDRVSNFYLLSKTHQLEFYFESTMDKDVVVHYFFATRSDNIHPYTSPKSVVQIDADTPKIPFLSLNTLLQRQFYKLCPHVFHRDLFLASKSMKELSCPIYVANNTWFHNQMNMNWDPLGRFPILIFFNSVL